MTELQYEETINKYNSRLFGYALKNTKNEDLSRDLVQDSFMKLWINRVSVPIEKAKSWLFTVTKNNMLNQLRSDKKVVNQDCQEHILDETKSIDFDIKNIIIKEVKKLPEIERRLILLRDMHDYTYSELGERLNLTESQVKVYLFRARKKLKDKLKSLKSEY